MSDFLDLVLARSYGSIPGAVGPRPVARFELPDHAPPDVETTPSVALATPAPAVPPAATPTSAPYAPAPTIVTREQITTRDLLTIRETAVRPALVAAEPHAAPVEPSQTSNVIVKQIASASEAVRGEPIAPIETQAQPAAPAARATPQPAAPRIAPLMPQPPAEPPPAPRPATPLVQVRIGRVELHGPAPAASPPRPPTPRSAPAPVRPVRSLDDYLRRRNEER